MVVKESRQSGLISVVVILAVVAVIALIGTAGWLVYQHNRPKTTNAASNQPQSTSPQTQQQTTTAPAPTVAYLDIKEWGIKVPLSNAIKDAYYIPNSSSPDVSNPDSIFVGLKSLDSNGCAAADSNNGKQGALALIGRAAPSATDPVSGKLYTELYPNGATIGTYYYFFQDRTKQLTCAPQATLQGISTAIAAASKNASVAP